MAVGKRKRSATLHSEQDADQPSHWPQQQNPDIMAYNSSEDEAVPTSAQTTRTASRAAKKPATYVGLDSDFDDEDEEVVLAPKSRPSARAVKQTTDDEDEDVLELTESEFVDLPKRRAAKLAAVALSKDSMPKARKVPGQKLKGVSAKSSLAATHAEHEVSKPAERTTSSSKNAYVSREINRLQSRNPDWKQFRLLKAPTLSKIQQLPDLRSTVVEEFMPKDVKADRGCLLHWLRSGWMLPTAKLWFDEWTKYEVSIKLMKVFLPLKDYPWRSQLEQVVKLAKSAESGRSRGLGASEAVLCSIYARKLFLCNRALLIENGLSSGKDIWHHLLDISCAALFAAYHDFITTAPDEASFFRSLLESPLASPMHDDIRQTVEKAYPLPVAHTENNPARFFEALASLKTDDFMPLLTNQSVIDHNAYYEYSPFSDKEQLAFWLAYEDDTKMSRLFGIDYKHIGELLPGRCEQEIHGFYKLNKANLGVETESRIIIARSGESVQNFGPTGVELAAASLGELDAGDKIEDGDESDAASEAEGDLEQELLSRVDGKTHPRPTEADALALLLLQSLNNGSSSSREPAEKTRGFVGLHLYVPPPRIPLQPPLPRKQVRPEIQAQIDAVSEAQRSRNEIELGLAWLQSNLEDAQGSEPAGQIDSLAVQMAWYERDEAAALLEERQSVLSKARRELVAIRKRFGGDGVEVVDLTGGSPEDEDAGESV